MKIVTGVRKELSEDGSHEHVEGVCTTDGTFYTRMEVASSLDAGEAWSSSAPGSLARIRKITHCPRPMCHASPYLTTEPDHTTFNNLENLPPC
jgi:hypothetical protein